ncbi:MAG: hypothetical protein JSS67_09400 [Bacteroidetes bacterium]|nr:hypothetical protein [Bacteroidota bacterium]
MQTGQLIFVIFFILFITLFSFLRDQKKKPLVLFFGTPFPNMPDLLTQMHKIAGFAYDFSWKNSYSLKHDTDFQLFENTINKMKPKVIFLYNDSLIHKDILPDLQYLDYQPWMDFCKKYALPLHEKRISLMIICNQEEETFRKLEITLQEYALNLMNLSDIIENREMSFEEMGLSITEINKLASKISFFLDNQS